MSVDEEGRGPARNAEDEEACPALAEDGAVTRLPRARADDADQEPDGAAWPPLVRAPGCDRADLLRRIVGG